MTQNRTQDKKNRCDEYCKGQTYYVYSIHDILFRTLCCKVMYKACVNPM